MKALVTLYPISRAISVEFVAENKEDGDFLASIKENMQKGGLDTRIIGYIDTAESTKSVTLSISTVYGARIKDMPAEPSKKLLC